MCKRQLKMRCMREKKMLKWFTRNTQREGEWERPHILRHSFVHVVRVGTAAQACRPATGTGTPPFHRRKLDQHSVSVLKGKKIPTWFQAKWKNRIFYLPMCRTHVRSLSLSLFLEKDMKNDVNTTLQQAVVWCSPVRTFSRQNWSEIFDFKTTFKVS